MHPASATVAGTGQALSAWETVYETVRRHQALGYYTPTLAPYALAHRATGTPDTPNGKEA